MLLFPIIDYCCVVCCDLTLDQDDKLQKLVNTGIYSIYGVQRSDHISLYRLEQGWLTTSARRKYFAANWLRSLFKTITPSYLLAIFNSRITTSLVRGNMAGLDISNCETGTVQRSFRISSAYLWNSLPSYRRDITSIPHFKSRLHYHHLFETVWYNYILFNRLVVLYFPYTVFGSYLAHLTLYFSCVIFYIYILFFILNCTT